MSRRIKRELKEFLKSPPTNISGNCIKKDIYEWEAIIFGPIATPYYGGIFKLQILFPVDYPYEPPKITFITRIFHPNIDKYGNICLDILKDKWSPSLTISKCLLSVCSMLNEPNIDDPLDVAAAELYKKNKLEYDMVAKSYTSQFA